ncbi:hypothetical protein LCGC14_1524650 [marine sediment metagenome]|uniref:Uncharacterized protein n=1 Tax=marine sediment metagenome TaxID=412755 RepID=A0A0F9LD35_9ZZZZ
MGDILRGALGTFVAGGLIILGFILFFVGIFSGNVGVVILGLLCWCFAYGIRYWLGHIIRGR